MNNTSYRVLFDTKMQRDGFIKLIGSDGANRQMEQTDELRFWENGIIHRQALNIISYIFLFVLIIWIQNISVLSLVRNYRWNNVFFQSKFQFFIILISSFQFHCFELTLSAMIR